MTMGRALRTPEKEREFLDALIASGGNVTEACRVCGIGRRTVYDWRSEDEVFEAAFKQACEYGTDVMEDEVTRRAFQGTEKPVFYLGNECGRIREYSDTLAIFMLKARRPEKFKDRSSVDTTLNGVVQIEAIERRIIDPKLTNG